MNRLAAAAGLLLLLGLAAPWLRRDGIRAPPAVPRHDIQPWMAEALPGVGAKTVPRMLDAIRSGRHELLSARARDSAAAWFRD